MTNDLGNIAYIDKKYRISESGFKKSFLDYLMSGGYNTAENTNTENNEHYEMILERCKQFGRDCKMIGLDVEAYEDYGKYWVKVKLPMSPAIKVLYERSQVR